MWLMASGTNRDRTVNGMALRTGHSRVFALIRLKFFVYFAMARGASLVHFGAGHVFGGRMSISMTGGTIGKFFSVCQAMTRAAFRKNIFIVDFAGPVCMKLLVAVSTF